MRGCAMCETKVLDGGCLAAAKSQKDRNGKEKLGGVGIDDRVSDFKVWLTEFYCNTRSWGDEIVLHSTANPQ